MNEEPKTEKKQWTKPELIVLVRSKPEEAVLAACKALRDGPTAQNDRCADDVGGGACGDCLSESAS
jgi:hypothetical protein